MKISFLKFLDRWLGAALAHLLPRPLSPPPGRPDPQSILIVRPGGIGDAVLLVPAIRALRKSFPQATVDVLAERRNANVFDLTPEVHQVFRYDRPQQLLKVLRRRYDLVIDTEQWHHLSAVIARLADAAVKIGFATNSRRRMFTHAIPYSLDDYEAVSFLRLLQPLGIDAVAAPAAAWLQVPPAARQEIAALLPGDGQTPLVVIFPGASIPEKQWCPERFRAVAKWCCESRLRVVVVGGAGERIAGDRMIAGLDRAVNLAGRTGLAGTAAVLERAAVVVSGDSGVLHIAAGLGRPTIALFGPSSPDKWAPKGEGHAVLRLTDCPACARFGYTPACPRQPNCMQAITAGKVIALLADLTGK